TTPYYFETFTVEQLKLEQEKIKKNPRKTLIFSNSDVATEYAKAYWLIDEKSKSIKGIRLMAKVETSDTATICDIPINIDDISLSGEITYPQKATFKIYKPLTPYILPKQKQIGPTLPQKPL